MQPTAHGKKPLKRVCREGKLKCTAGPCGLGATLGLAAAQGCGIASMLSLDPATQVKLTAQPTQVKLTAQPINIFEQKQCSSMITRRCCTPTQPFCLPPLAAMLIARPTPHTAAGSAVPQLAATATAVAAGTPHLVNIFIIQLHALALLCYLFNIKDLLCTQQAQRQRQG